MNLLSTESTPVGGGVNILLIILFAVFGVIFLAAAIYGAIRGFYRLTWIGFELLIAYGLELLIPSQTSMAVSVLLLILFTALPLLGEHFLRRAVLTGRILKKSTGEKVFDHIFGAFTAMIAVAMFFVAAAGLVLPAVGIFADLSGQVPAVIMDHALDFFLIAVCLVTMRAGCRLGILKGFNMLFTVGLTFGAFLGFFLIFSQVKGGVAFSGSVGGWFGLNGTPAAFVGCFVLTLFFSILAFVLIMLLSKLIDRGIQGANSHMAVAIPDALILGIAYTVLFIFVILGIQAVFGLLARGDLLSSMLGNAFDFGNIDSSIAEFGGKLAAFAKSSPISAGFYIGNPFI